MFGDWRAVRVPYGRTVVVVRSTGTAVLNTDCHRPCTERLGKCLQVLHHTADRNECGPIVDLRAFTCAVVFDGRVA